ncbi:MAG TPA: D-alanyl-D-alanine carboxypeptidase/D-alanyl-D-alanine-endopeptidase, partial [Actinomycetes bacterium]|nr:D-alanyl-D-alanine carboxypeptidase/D-alanyl-D-alanine-endopeptidase [Actinomycetes bacterium]
EPATPSLAPLNFESPRSLTPVMATANTNGPRLLPSEVRDSLIHALADKSLGPRVQASVTTADGTSLLSIDAGLGSTPASTIKLLTATAVLDSVPPSTVLETRVVRGQHADDIVLVGGGDATLTVDSHRGQPWASLERLARRTAKQLKDSGANRVHLDFDDSLFTGPEIAPTWEPDYVTSGVVAPVTALMADQGLVSDKGLDRYPAPAVAAADEFADLLERAGVTVRGDPQSVRTAATADSLAAVQSPPVAQLVERMLRDSDNQLAEALGRVVALSVGEPGSFNGASQAIVSAAHDRGISLNADHIHDASGLSRDDLVPTSALAGVLVAASNDDQLEPILEGLPVSGFDGTLVDRYLSPPESDAAGVVRAKTGTLTGVSAEAGTTVTCDGQLVVFAFMADRVPYDTVAARDALDRAAASLSSCP